MPVVYKTSVLVEYRLRCLHRDCQREQKLVHGRSWNIGETIMPAVGHGDLGRCVFCWHDGLLVLQIIEAEPDTSTSYRPPWS